MSDAPAHHLFCLLGPVDPAQSTLPEVLCFIQVSFIRLKFVKNDGFRNNARIDLNRFPVENYEIKKQYLISRYWKYDLLLCLKDLIIFQVSLEGEISKDTIMNSLSRGKRASGDLIPWTISQQVLHLSLLPFFPPSFYPPTLCLSLSSISPQFHKFLFSSLSCPTVPVFFILRIEYFWK